MEKFPDAKFENMGNQDNMPRYCKYAFVGENAEKSEKMVITVDKNLQLVKTSTFNFANYYAIDSVCDWFLTHQLEYQIPESSQWYKDNFSEEYQKLRNSINDEKWDDENYKASALNTYHESLKEKTIS